MRREALQIFTAEPLLFSARFTHIIMKRMNGVMVAQTRSGWNRFES